MIVQNRDFYKLRNDGHGDRDIRIANDTEHLQTAPGKAIHGQKPNLLFGNTELIDGPQYSLDGLCCGHFDEWAKAVKSRWNGLSSIIITVIFEVRGMDNYSVSELKELSREELVNIILRDRQELIDLQERLGLMKADKFGSKSEILNGLTEQTTLYLNEVESVFDETKDDPEDEEQENTETITYTRRKSKGKRVLDLSGFEKQIINHELTEEELTTEFGDEGYKRLPDQIYSKLEMIPARYYVEEHHVAVYASKSSDKIVRAPHPVQMLEKSIATPGMIAGIWNAKYTNGIPLNRIEQEHERLGIPVSKQTMCNWTMMLTDRYISQIYGRMHSILLDEPIIQADETYVKVAKNSKDNEKSQMWVYRTGEYEKSHPIILYEYSAGRTGDVPRTFLNGFQGILESDGYQVYSSMDRDDPGITSACCWAHARRRFADAVKAAKNNGNSTAVMDSLAYRCLEKISLIYSRDEKLKGYSPEERKKRRQTLVKPKVEEFFEWAKSKADDAATELTRKGFTYLLNHEKELKVFLDNGNVPIDNSATERAIRPFTVGRKNWMMIATESGAKASAMLYSIVETCKANRIKIYEYFKLLLTVLPEHENDTDTDYLDSLLPWSQDLPESCKLPEQPPKKKKKK